MTTFKSNKVEKSLRKKGFVQQSGDHNYFELWIDGKLISRTKTSHNGQDIGEHLIHAMSKQCHLNKNDFLDLINCPLSAEGYVEKLKIADII